MVQQAAVVTLHIEKIKKAAQVWVRKRTRRVVDTGFLDIQYRCDNADNVANVSLKGMQIFTVAWQHCQ